MKNQKRPFDILLIGEASGTGKSCVSDALSKIYGMNVVQVDDFQCIVEHYTKEEDYPVFHYWNNHFEEAINRTMILEGDFISPQLCKKLMEDSVIKSRIKCIYIIEDNKAQIVENYYNREGSIQNDRAELSLMYNNWLKEQIEGTEIIPIQARPWESSTERICAILEH